MCILTFFPPGATPNLDALAGGAIANPHGHGYAVLADDALVVGHGLDPATVITEFAAVRAEFPDTPALFHSRLATHGRVSADNCHPFALGGDERTVLAHNGILPATVHPTLGDPRSDTRIAAEDYLPTVPFGSLDSWTGRAGLEHWLGTDKMVLLTVDPAYRQRAYLFNEHHGHWHKGIWYSNHSYRWASAGFDYTDTDYCLNCGEFEPEWFGAHCTFCGFCQDCLAEYPDCQCPPFEGTADRYADLQYSLDLDDSEAA
ncbi:class II glutamine amidotransferase [Nocardia terpenica]|uniref:class II glutamine amidotransferase n=1 Tax=Nocardia terpenica TaxID=455432 RepID=UPI0018940778|nr:class II glutamine amidotransferase [Nocardia terpenica]MBF6063550.1 class II glutamine amidotransferase [Nocardia terpenica]MBF6106106.1 class II glutamine amidotransferase [Nocardia terpenica]MBF6113309.1 class II glutamine amidotransferase [Nocardia terpenica]MBF6119847.1 class II glutamine amidotransferase [Nocardia terpenica]MBF6152258.1 class II glutamine amidotransferase [Nocardia terpenica]